MLIDSLVILLLMVLNGLLAMSELALVSSRKARLKALADGGSRGARAALKVLADPGEFLATVQIGITLVGIFAGAFGGAALAGPFGAWLDTLPWVAPNGEAIGLALVVVAITYLSLVVGELVPKRIALRHPETVAAAMARPMRILSRIATPAVWLLKVSTDRLLLILGLRGARDSTVSEEEIRSMIAEGTTAGVFAPQEKEMIDGVLRLADRSVRAVMTPRRDVVWADVAAPEETLLRHLRGASFTRFPVCAGSLDEIVGIADTNDLLTQRLNDMPLDLRACAKPALVVHDNLNVLRLLDVFRQDRSHFAVVVDEFGSVEGVVTLTDVMEAIAGEFPEIGDETEPGIVRRADGSWLVDGRTPIDELRDRLDLPPFDSDGSYHTVAGLVLFRLGRIPDMGDSIDLPGLRIEVVDMDGRRVDRVLLTRDADGSGAIIG